MKINWLDILILLPLLIGFVRGLMRGLVSEFIAILAVILGCLGAKLWGAAFSAWLLRMFTWPEAVCDVVSYALLFLAITVALNYAGRLLSRILKAIHLGWVNRLLGGVFGTAKYAVIVLAVVFLVDTLDRQFAFMQPDLKASSVTYDPAVRSAHQLLNQVKHVDLPLLGK